MTDLFNVITFFPDDSYEYVRRNVGAQEAVEAAKDFSERPASRIGVIHRIIITDGGDSTCFEWINGKGVTFPPRQAA